jgi:hypothetical protein
VFKPITIFLYQPDEVLKARLPGGAAVLSAYIQRVQGTVGVWYTGQPISAPGPRTLLIAVGAGKRFQMWLLPETVVDPVEPRMLSGILKIIPPPDIRNGAVIFGLHYTIAEQVTAPPPTPPVPVEWREAAQKLSGQAEVEAVVLHLWQAQDAAGSG